MILEDSGRILDRICKVTVRILQVGTILGGFWEASGGSLGSLRAPWGLPGGSLGGARRSPAPVWHRDPQKISKVCNGDQKQGFPNSSRQAAVQDFGTTRGVPILAH